MAKLNPTVLWAQRSDRVFVTLDVQDCKEPTIKFDNDEAAGAGTLDFAGTSGDGKDFELKLSLHTTIKPDECKVAVRPRKIELLIMKAVAKDNWWSCLTKEKTKDPHIKVDWNKYVEEDEEDEADPTGGFDMSAMQDMANFSGMGGMPGMDLGDMDGEDDSDDDDLPDLEPAAEATPST